MKKSVKVLISFFLVAVLLCCGAFVLVKVSPNVLYILKDVFSGMKPKQVLSLADNSLKTEQVLFDELQSDERCSFDQSLMLINTSYRLSSDFTPHVAEYMQSGVYFNTCMFNAYTALKQAVLNETDDNLYIMSAYRSREEQAAVIETEGETAAQLDCSEHQAGLAADVYVMYYAGMGFLDSEAGKFVNENCGDYGFIIRYPYYGTQSTGIDYEPWHIRFVGLPHSQAISDGKLTLEEYIESLTPGKFFTCGSYIVSRQKIGDSIEMPLNYSSAVISYDNTEHVIVTAKVN